MSHTAVTAAAICAASWVGLFIGAGNIGLQRSVSIGPLTLLELPVAVALASGLSFLVALGSRHGGLTSQQSLRVVAHVLVGDAIAALVLAPLAVGELTPFDAPVVFATLTVLGLQPLAAFAGSIASQAVQSTDQ